MLGGSVGRFSRFFAALRCLARRFLDHFGASTSSVTKLPRPLSLSKGGMKEEGMGN
ncbi:MAG: hypothetical protein LBB89_13640 [Treponema sp.]|nr:hypothetical protein [Treponema sp.]